MAHIAKYNKDRLDIDIKCTVNKLFCHFSSSAKRTELKIIFELVEEEYHSLLRHKMAQYMASCYKSAFLLACCEGILFVSRRNSVQSFCRSCLRRIKTVRDNLSGYRPICPSSIMHLRYSMMLSCCWKEMTGLSLSCMTLCPHFRQNSSSDRWIPSLE